MPAPAPEVRFLGDFARSRIDARKTATLQEVAVFSHVVAFPRKPFFLIAHNSFHLHLGTWHPT
ncbi:hypothetical protein C1708_28920 [Streptomyces sp. DH-12]|nr:hypothetical protein C1708_28920 [Streptomyces sp. DH-12]